MCERLLLCSSEADFVRLLKLDGENAIKFMFYYLVMDNLSKYIIGNGFCSIRKTLALAMGLILELPNEIEKEIVTARDIDLTSPEGCNTIIYFISVLLVKLQGDCISLRKDYEIRERFVRQLTGMKSYI